MSDRTTKTPRVIDLAEELISDIKAKKLVPGDRYLTTADASRLLGVGNGAANRALQLLERRQIIRRQQRSGAFIASLPGKDSPPALRRVHFLVHQKYYLTEGVGNDLELLGMQEELPGVHVQISFLPKENAAEFVSELIKQSLSAKAKDGLVLVRSPYDVHKLVSSSGLPAIVYGGVYPGNAQLTRLDRDMKAIGSLAADYLLQKKRKRIAFLSRQEVLPGDHDTLDAIRERLSANKLLVDALTERFLPSDASIYEAEIVRLLEKKHPPTGFICRTKRMADAVVSVAKAMQLKQFSDFDVVVCDYYLSKGMSPEYVYPRPVHSAEEFGRHVARMLAAQASGVSVQDEITPVELDTTAEI